MGLVALGLLLGVRVHQALIAQGLPLHADEAGHALPAARMTMALNQGEPGAFLALSLNEVQWPFLHPWLLTSFFIAFGISADVARTSSLVTFGAGLCLLPPLARRLWFDDPGHDRLPPPLLGLLSVVTLISTAPWRLVSTVMSEPLGMFLTLLALLMAAKARTRDTLVWYGLGGLLAALAFLTKYSYGLPLMVALPLAAASPSPSSRIRQFASTLAGACVPVAAWGLGVLWSDPDRGPEILGAMVNLDEGHRGLSNLFFYAGVVLSSVGVPVGLAVIILLVVALFRPHTARLPALLLATTTLLLLTAHPNKQERYLFAVLPVILVIAETEAARILGRRGLPFVAWPLVAAAILVARNPLVQLDEQAADASTLRGGRSIVSYVADHVVSREPILFLGTTGLLPHLALTWELIERGQREPDVDLLVFPGSSGWDPRYQAGYPAEASPEYDVHLQEALTSERYRSVVTLRLGPHSPFRPDWLAKWDAWTQNYVDAAERHVAAGGYSLISERAFPEDDAIVRVHVRDAAVRPQSQTPK